MAFLDWYSAWIFFSPVVKFPSVQPPSMTPALTKDLFTPMMTEMITSPKQHWTIIYKLCVWLLCVYSVRRWSGYSFSHETRTKWHDHVTEATRPRSLPFSLVSELSLSQTTCQCHSLTYWQNAACAGNAAWTTVASSTQCVNMDLIRHIVELKRHVRLKKKEKKSHVKWHRPWEVVKKSCSPCAP